MWAQFVTRPVRRLPAVTGRSRITRRPGDRSEASFSVVKLNSGPASRGTRTDRFGVRFRKDTFSAPPLEGTYLLVQLLWIN